MRPPIRHARDLGFSLGVIRDLLKLAGHPDQLCVAADQIARRQLDAVRSPLARLRVLESELERMLTQGAHGTVGDCCVMADHRLCLQDHAGGDTP
ncbi:MAG: MerR family DNA-binding protein [Paracoccus sp. (in: a-proteobacteria)]|uniref:MerR family DNA-binding protein n=1 Tax=Paracoccus sp. TaxID=267 RepID=UPI0026DF575C|nr:MerR family DNA-binding protein [Paracoccus sp. (in: a-proteobacteria)]MDO5632336.1 MerR family DNA-binding protein [Paracoccus sp. (in: a-proteobacteria)]